MKVLIHVGFPKTASSWFQFRFFPKVTNYKMVERNDVVKYLITPDALSFEPQHTRNSIIEAYGNNLILSLEGFTGTTHNFGMHGYLTKEHAQRLYATFPEATVILFLRRQPDIIASFYLQYINGGGTYSIDKYLNHRYFDSLIGLPLFTYTYFEYDKVIQLYSELFGTENLKVFLFEEFAENPKLFIEKFIADFEIETDFTKIDYTAENEGLRTGIKFLFGIANQFTALKMLNKHHILHIPYWYEFYKYWLKKANRMPLFGKRIKHHHLLGVKTHRYIQEYYKPSNQRLIDDFSITKIKNYQYPL